MPDPSAEQRRIDQEIRVFGERVVPNVNQISAAEEWWKQHYDWLKNRGYLLRPRYSPDWSPSWITSKKNSWNCEDGIPARFSSQLLDATRISDGAYVVLKRVKRSVHPFEVEIGQFLCTEPLDNERENHSVSIYEVFQIPEDDGIDIMVMPLLSEYANVPFDTIGEVVECFRQLFEGLLFMHKHHVAHRDCTSMNVMVDPTTLYIDPFHPVWPKMKRDFSGPARFRTRTEGRPKYFFIDFGLSRRYDSAVTAPKEYPIRGADKTVPEFQNSGEPCDPFPTDVYYIGNMIRNDFMETTRGLEFMQPLIDSMVQDDPSKRPTMQQVVDRFDVIRAGLSVWKLRSRAVDTAESLFEGVVLGIVHWVRRVKFITKGIPALPTPSS